MPFLKTEIDFQLTGSIPPLVSDYLAQKDFLKPFFSFVTDSEGFQKGIENRKLSIQDRKILVEVLREQNGKQGADVKKNIEALLDEKTFTITTGHQLNLFTGPLYFIFKILSAIKLAQWLKIKFPQNNFVPVYWMASEDHDIDEINHTFIFGKQVSWKTNGKGAAGKLSCEGMADAIESVKTIVGNGEQEKKIIDLLVRAYAKENSLSEATRILVDGLFGKYGLVILDADDSRLKKLFLPVMKEEILGAVSFQKTSETIHALEKLNYNVQVHPREINLFFLSENARERIIKADGKYKVLNSAIEWDEAGIIKALCDDPGHFSPNVVLRPLYQETVLPNLAYVGGPAELSYWFEFKSMFDYFNVDFPLLILRNCAMIIDKGSLERMQKLQITKPDFFKSYDDLAKEFVLRNIDSFSMADEVSKINEVYDSLILKVTDIDPTLAKSLEGEKQKQRNALLSLEEKITRSQKKKHEVSLQQIQKLKDRFFPGGLPQERHENFIPFYLKYGESFFDMLLETFQPVTRHSLFIEE